MGKESKTGKLDAFALFPDLMKDDGGVAQPKGGSNTTAATVGGERKRQPVPRAGSVAPPLSPDLGWLRSGNYENLEQNELKDIPTALVLMKGSDAKDSVFSTLKELGYLVVTTETASDAIHNLNSTDCAAIVMHANFEEEPVSLAESTGIRLSTTF